MGADELIKCCIQASAIIRLCETAAWSIQNCGEDEIPQIAEDIQYALQLAAELIGPAQDALESHEGLKGGVN
ncbi:hypothetical protein ASD64_19985 [Mesorhizobium sp. Root157]|nr:hypothetical protein ASD64_19985 [Mesorhizobium sp. Root157]